MTDLTIKGFSEFLSNFAQAKDLVDSVNALAKQIALSNSEPAKEELLNKLKQWAVLYPKLDPEIVSAVASSALASVGELGVIARILYGFQPPPQP